MTKKAKRDKLILTLKQEVEDKKKAIVLSTKFKAKTNLVLYIKHNTYNLNVLVPLDLLILLGTLDQLLQTVKIHKFAPLRDISGFPIESWIYDIKGKYELFIQKEEKTKLKILEDKLDKLLSSEYKEEQEFNELVKQVRE